MRGGVKFIVILAVHTITVFSFLSFYYKNKNNNFDAFINSNNTLVSVIVPIHNSEKYLTPFLDSIFTQTLPQIEYIFVDDLSPDNSTQLIEEYINSHSIPHSVLLLHNDKNIGPGPSRNAGIAVAKGEYVCFIDPDDWLSPRYFEHLYAGTFARNGARYDVTKGTMIRAENNTRKVSKRGLLPVSGRKPYVFEQFSWQHFTGMFRRSLLMEHQDARYGSSLVGEDFFFLMTVGFYAKNISFVDKAKYFYRVRKGSLSRERNADFYINDLESMKDVIAFYFEHIKPDGSADGLVIAMLKKLKEWRKIVNSLHIKTQDDRYLLVLKEYAKLEFRLNSFLNGIIVY